MSMKQSLKKLFSNKDNNFRLNNKNYKNKKVNQINKIIQIGVHNVQIQNIKYLYQKKKYKIKIIKLQNQKISYNSKIIATSNNIMQ